MSRPKTAAKMSCVTHTHTELINAYRIAVTGATCSYDRNGDRRSPFNHYSERMREFKNVGDKMGAIASKSWSTTGPYT